MYYEAGKVWILEKLNDSWSIGQELVRDDPYYSDLFGESVAISGSYAVVGAPNEDLTGKTDAGAVYVFKNIGGTWTQTVKLTASDAAAYDQFGHAVDIHGDYIIVGAPHNDSAYIFKLENNVWVQQPKLYVSSPDTFGNSVAITDGYAIIGDYTDDDENGTASGTAYIFKLDTNGTWVQDDQIFPTNPQQLDHFGGSVSIDGEYAIVGAPHTDNSETGPQELSGSAFIFKRINNEWIQLGSALEAGDSTSGGNHFGISVSISGNYAVVGASGDNDKGENAGAAFLYRKKNEYAWEDQSKFLTFDGNTNHYFGSSVAIDKGDILIGAHGYSGSSRMGVVFWHSFLFSDFDNDGDVDGLDLNTLTENLTNGIVQSDYIPNFAQSFGYDSYMAAASATMMQSSSLFQMTDSVELISNTINYDTAFSTIQTDQDEEEIVENFEIEEVSWTASNGQYGFATGTDEWEWQIDEISLNHGSNFIKVIVRDTSGNIAEKEIEVVYAEVLGDDQTNQAAQWVRRLTYELKFDDTELSEETTPTTASLTTWLWPDKIIMTDDYLNPDTTDISSITTEDGFNLDWSIECDEDSRNILYLDIPLELIESE